MNKYNQYLKKLEQHPFNFWKINDVAFNYLHSRLKYLEKEKYLMSLEYFKNRKNLNKQERDHYLYRDWLLNNEKHKTLNKWVDVEQDLLKKLGVENEQ